MQQSIAKIVRPRLSGVIERVRLQKHLDALMKNKVIWISAPAGSGKTTLVASWLDARNFPSIWYQVDDGDADVATIFSFLNKAGKQAIPKNRVNLPHFTAEYRSEKTIFTKRYFQLLFARLKAPFVFVLDNYQDVSPESDFHEVVQDGLNVLPEGVTAVVMSRANPPAQFSRLIANGHLALVDWKEVKFSPDESRELIEKREKKRRTAYEINELHRKTEGWAAGLVLLTGNANLSDDGHESPPVSAERIFDYFAIEVFKSADRETKQFLLMTAFLHTMTAESAAELTGNTHADKILSKFSRENFFTQRRAVPEVTYQYHPLFREFLQFQARDHFTAEDLQLIKKKAARQLLKSDMPEEAARLFVELSDWQSLAGVIHQNGASFIAQGRFLTLGTWINRMPAEQVEQNGRLLYWKAMCRIATRPAEARVVFEKAYSLFQSAHDVSGLFLSWSGVVESYLYEWKNFRPLDYWIDQFLQLLKQNNNNFPTEEIGERATSAIFSALIFRQPHNPELAKWTDHAYRVMQRTKDFSRRVIIGYTLILYYIWTGRIIQAGSLVSMLIPGIETEHVAPLPRLMWYRTEALYHLYAGRYDTGRAISEKGLRLAEETGIHHFDQMFLGMCIYFSGMNGETVPARQYLGKMASSLGKKSCFEEMFFAHQESLVALLTGDLDSAVQLGERCMQLYREAEAPLLLGPHQFVLANILMEAGRYDLLRQNLDEMRSRDALIKSMHYEAWCSASEAVVAMREGNDELFAERFSVAAKLFLRSGVRIVVMLRKTLFLLCTKALSLGIETAFVKELVELNKLTPDGMSNLPESWPWPVKINTLGRFEVFLNDRVMQFSGKVQKKPLELLKAVIASGGRNVSVDQLTDALWPDVDGDAAKTSFDTTLHRLRKLLGTEKALILTDGVLSLDDSLCRIDTWAFHEAVAGENDIKTLEKAVCLYRGHFLPGDLKHPWTISLREHFRSKFVTVILKTGMHWEHQNEHRKAKEYYLRGLEIDNLCEEFYQRLMICLLAEGQESEAMKVYNRCSVALDSGLGISPSRKTEEIIKEKKKYFRPLIEKF